MRGGRSSQTRYLGEPTRHTGSGTIGGMPAERNVRSPGVPNFARSGERWTGHLGGSRDGQHGVVATAAAGRSWGLGGVGIARRVESLRLRSDAPGRVRGRPSAAVEGGVVARRRAGVRCRCGAEPPLRGGPVGHASRRAVAGRGKRAAALARRDAIRVRSARRSPRRRDSRCATASRSRAVPRTLLDLAAVLDRAAPSSSAGAGRGTAPLRPGAAVRAACAPSVAGAAWAPCGRCSARTWSGRG